MFIPGLLEERQKFTINEVRHEAMYRELLRTDWGSWRASQYRLLLASFYFTKFFRKNECEIFVC